MSQQREIVKAVRSLPPGVAPWQTLDPFLFCVHHYDKYPAGNDRMAPDPKLLRGRHIGSDFEGQDGWRMYHGEEIPGFPQHPHRGFETITIMKQGTCDHFDSLGATGRLGPGDIQWMTAGKGIVHCEMFPLLNKTEPNPMELFQIWINLPKASKMVPADFTMYWAHDVPKVEVKDENGKKSEVMVYAGTFQGSAAKPPPKNSWAAIPGSNVAIWLITLNAGATLELPGTDDAECARALYYFEGAQNITIGKRSVAPRNIVECHSDGSVLLENTRGDTPVRVLMLQGRPIGEPKAQYGPFVMNTQEEIQEAFADYRKTGFGGWPWPSSGPVHPREVKRYAKHPDGREERPDVQ